MNRNPSPKQKGIRAGGHAIRIPSHRAQMGIQTKAEHRGTSCDAQDLSGGEGLRPEARSGFRRRIRVGGKVGIRPPIAGNHDTLLLGGPPRGREVHFPQRRVERDGLHPTTTWLPGQRQPDKILGLHKALNGIRQAPRAWNAKLDNTLLSLKFKRCVSVHDMYTRSHVEQQLIVGVYVDDLIITRGDMKVLGRFKREMSKNFKMSDLGVLSYYLDIKVQ